MEDTKTKKTGHVMFIFAFQLLEHFVQGGAAAIQQIVIEGPLSEEYYMIREYLYSQFYSL